MKKGILLPVVFALLAAAVYMWLLNGEQKKIKDSKTTKMVLVADRDIKERDVIKREYLKRVAIPAAYIQKDAFIWNSESDFAKVDNAIARVQIPKGNQLSKYAITSLSPEAGLSSKIPVDMRGFIITVDSNVASMVKPDDNVDVLLTFEANMKSGARQKVTVTLLQNVKVLGVGSNLGQGLDAKAAAAMRNEEENASAYTDTSALSLALSTRDAQYLALAKEEGTLTVTLRSPGDLTRFMMDIATFEKLFQ
ncbi:MAG: Flp pilus assembly protein CpaB [Elusimicrobiaceae bacterium]|nr:Flp pilus assembly protein CpaB [Elusimicrobiaceae bacterium]